MNNSTSGLRPATRTESQARADIAAKRQPRAFEIEPGHCPYPIENDDGSAAMCVRNGHCGCDEMDKCARPIL